METIFLGIYTPVSNFDSVEDLHTTKSSVIKLCFHVNPNWKQCIEDSHHFVKKAPICVGLNEAKCFTCCL